MMVLNCEADKNKNRNIAIKQVLFLSENLRGKPLYIEGFGLDKLKNQKQ